MLAKKALGGAPASVPVFIEDTFSSYLYTGNGSTQTITNGIDLSGEGGLVWIKGRSNAEEHALFDTNRGAGNYLQTQSTAAQSSESGFSSFGSSGFSLAANVSVGINNNTRTYSSWTFRKAEKFFDVVTWTGDGTSNRTINHNLGSTPGCVIVKNTSSAEDWPVYHRSLGFSTGGSPYNGLRLNGTNATGTYDPPISAASSTTITLTTSGSNTNRNGQTYVAYLFAHDAGGFGDAGDQNVISCGSFAHNASGATVNLGWEPQWILVKAANQAVNWYIFDCMRGLVVGGSSGDGDAALFPNLSDAENINTWGIDPTATGFIVYGNNILSSGNAIYIAIRRGPMKTPEVGTEVFTPALASSSGVYTATAGFPVDMVIYQNRASPSSFGAFTFDRLRGSGYLGTTNTSAENAAYGAFDNNSNFRVTNSTGDFTGYINWMFKRAPGFFDVVCYTGNSSAQTFSHNLGATPELMIVKRRDATSGWIVYYNGWSDGRRLILQGDAALYSANSDIWNNTAPTSTQFTVGTTLSTLNATYVNYMFASVTGVSKVGSYTGNGSSQTINCGFTSGARFVLIKRTDSTGDWVVFDTARGIVSGNDPYLKLNTSDAEVTNKDAVDTDSTGFVVNETSGPNINTNSATYIYLAIA